MGRETPEGARGVMAALGGPWVGVWVVREEMVTASAPSCPPRQDPWENTMVLMGWGRGEDLLTHFLLPRGRSVQPRFPDSKLELQQEASRADPREDFPPDPGWWRADGGF